MNQQKTLRLTLMSLMAALAYIAFTYVKINIPSPTGGSTAIHFGNIFCVLTALLLGGVEGGIAGAIGMGLADIMDPIYITSAPKTLFLKFMIGVITGFVAHRIFHLSSIESPKKTTFAVVVASSCGILFNVIGEPIVSYLYTRFILGAADKAASKLASLNLLTTSFNALTTVILVSILYMLLWPRLKHHQTLKKLAPQKK